MDNEEALNRFLMRDTIMFAFQVKSLVGYKILFYYLKSLLNQEEN